jgi:hypothetical protein
MVLAGLVSSSGAKSLMPELARSSCATYSEAFRAMADLALWSMSARFDEMCSQTGRPLTYASAWRLPPA